MTWPLVIEMLGAPRGKGTVRRDRLPNGAFVAHPDPRTAGYEDDLRTAARMAMGGRPLLPMALRVLVEADFAIPQSWSEKKKREARRGVIAPIVKPDWDNLGKICDACNSLIWIDDKQIVEGCVRKRYSDRPLIRISVWPWHAEEQPAGRRQPQAAMPA